jgi:hypothetical protein
MSQAYKTFIFRLETKKSIRGPRSFAPNEKFSQIRHCDIDLMFWCWAALRPWLCVKSCPPAIFSKTIKLISKIRKIVSSFKYFQTCFEKSRHGQEINFSWNQFFSLPNKALESKKSFTFSARKLKFWCWKKKICQSIPTSNERQKKNLFLLLSRVKMDKSQILLYHWTNCKRFFKSPVDR